MKNIVAQILIATVAGVLSSIIWAGLQAPLKAPDGPGLLRVLWITDKKKPPQCTEVAFSSPDYLLVTADNHGDHG